MSFGKKFVLMMAFLAVTALFMTSCDLLDDDEADPIKGSKPELAIMLIPDSPIMTKGSIGVGEKRWYYFYAEADTTYNLFIDDGSPFGSGDYTCWLDGVAVYRPDILDKNRLSVSGGGEFPVKPYYFTAVATEKVYLKFEPGDSQGNGTFAIQLKKDRL